MSSWLGWGPCTPRRAAGTLGASPEANRRWGRTPPSGTVLQSKPRSLPFPRPPHTGGQDKWSLPKYISEFNRAQRLMCPLDQTPGKRRKKLLKKISITHSTNYTPICPSGMKVPCLLPYLVSLGHAQVRAAECAFQRTLPVTATKPTQGVSGGALDGTLGQELGGHRQWQCPAEPSQRQVGWEPLNHLFPFPRRIPFLSSPQLRVFSFSCHSFSPVESWCWCLFDHSAESVMLDAMDEK